MCANYLVRSFVRTYNSDGKLNYWSPRGNIRVEARSLDEAMEKGKLEIMTEFEKQGIETGDFLVDSIIEPSGNHVQCTAWDESGFPVLGFGCAEHSISISVGSVPNLTVITFPIHPIITKRKRADSL